MARKRLLHRLAYTYLTLIGFFGRLFLAGFMLWFAVLIGNFLLGGDEAGPGGGPAELSRILETSRSRADGPASLRPLRQVPRRLHAHGCAGRKASAPPGPGFEGKEHIDGAIARGKGTLILTAHLGNWEMGGDFPLSLMGYSLTVITAPTWRRGLPNYRVRLRHEQKIKVVTWTTRWLPRWRFSKRSRPTSWWPSWETGLVRQGDPGQFFRGKSFLPIGPALLSYLSEPPSFPLLC